MPHFSNKDAFCAGLDAWLDKAEQTCLSVYKGLVVSAYFELARETPQWSGNAAANWMIGLGAPDTSVTFSLKQRRARGANRVASRGYAPPVASKGDPRAIMEGASRENPKLPAIRLDAPGVYISNSSQNLAGQSYIQHLEANTNDFLRSVNRPGAMVKNAPGKLGLGRLDADGINRLTRLGEGGLLGMG